MGKRRRKIKANGNEEDISKALEFKHKKVPCLKQYDDLLSVELTYVENLLRS